MHPTHPSPSPRSGALRSLVPLGVLVPLLLTGCPGTPPESAGASGKGGPPKEVQAAAERITAEAIASFTQLLSSDAMEGRGPASAGDTKARQAIAEAFAAAGLQPGAEDGSWEQPFAVVGITTQAPPVWNFQAGDEVVPMRFWDDYIATSGVQQEEANLQDAELVFVGYGIEAPEYAWDDYGDTDLTGKVLLMLNNDPDWDPELFEGDRRLYYGRWTYKYEIAAARGAAGAIIIHTEPSAGYGWAVVQNSWTGAQFELPAEGEARLQVAGWLTADAAGRLVAAMGLDLSALEESARSASFAPVPLGITTSLELTNEIERVTTANVLGLLPGSDPERSGEVVVYTAHHDHLGIGPADDDGDTIFNGARDNAAGVAQLVAIARGYAALPEPPRRSVLFLAVGAEEQGLLGSKYYAGHPTFPPGKIAANLNYDAPGIWGRTRDVQLVGMGKSELDSLARRMADFQGREVVPEIDPTTGSYYRSDQFSFAKIGVPALYFGQGSDYLDPPEGFTPETVEAWGHEHYHQQSDEYDASWNLEGAAENARLGFYCGWAIAQDTTMPGWMAGDEFEATRKAALAAVAADR